MVCNDHTDSFTFFTAHWFYAILPNVPSDLPALYPLKKLFPGINEDFFYTCILGFFVDVPSVRRSLMILFLVDLLRNLKEKSYYIPAIRSSHVLCWIYSYIDPSWQNFCSALFLLPVFSCHVLSDLSGLFIFYKRFLHTHHSSPTIAHKKSADQVIFDSLHSIFMIGICIMIFSIAVSLLEILPLPFYLKRGLTAVLEITMPSPILVLPICLSAAKSYYCV